MAAIHDFNQAVFLAALQGITANPHFFGSLYQQDPRAAVEFAVQCVQAMQVMPDWVKAPIPEHWEPLT